MEFRSALNQLLNRQDLSFDDMVDVMQHVMGGALTPVQISAFLIALRMKGETVDEIAAAASVMRQLSSKVDIQDRAHLIDTCGTGGDGIQTFNVSTAAAFVATAAGARVAKHGGRSVSSTCGSADVLEAMGVSVTHTADEVADIINRLGVGFMFAPNHHSAMKHAAPVRKELGVRTLFNLLGPLTNPASAKRQVMGVFDKALTVKLANVLKKLGSEHVMVVHGEDGMDEITFTGNTYVAELKQGNAVEYVLHPSQFGLSVHAIELIKIQDVASSKAMLLGVLAGNRSTPSEQAARDIVLMNAGAAIYVAGKAETLAHGIQRAAEVIDAGLAMASLNALQQAG